MERGDVNFGTKRLINFGTNLTTIVCDDLPNYDWNKTNMKQGTSTIVE